MRKFSGLTGKDVQKAADLLKAGKLVAIPTETVYGLAANALDEHAVSDIFRAKQRPHFDPLIIHVGSVDEIYKYTTEIPDRLWKLATRFMPGPLTLLLPKKDNISDLVTAGSPLVAVRIPAHPLSLKLLSMLDFPLAAPSANPFGYISPTTPHHVEAQLGDKVAYILDGGPCTVGIESTIVGIDDGRLTVFRKGGLAIEKIKSVADAPVKVWSSSTSNPKAPGMLTSHYAPRAKMIIAGELPAHHQYSVHEIAAIRFRDKLPGLPEQNQVILSPQGNYEEAARQLFAGMRSLDRPEIKIILAELLPEEDLGIAINDRLRRAAADFQD